jgi:hypothetical protein
VANDHDLWSGRAAWVAYQIADGDGQGPPQLTHRAVRCPECHIEVMWAQPLRQLSAMSLISGSGAQELRLVCGSGVDTHHDEVRLP